MVGEEGEERRRNSQRMDLESCSEVELQELIDRSLEISPTVNLSVYLEASRWG